jgi:hypothetical protein
MPEKITFGRIERAGGFSSNVKVAPGHFVDHDNGMDCRNTGAVLSIEEEGIIVAIRLPCRRCSSNGFTRSPERHIEGR